MTPTQISRLCELEPERFTFYQNTTLYWEIVEDRLGLGSGMEVASVADPVFFSTGRAVMLWWMLQTMRARFDCLDRHIRTGAYDTHTTDGPWSNPEYMTLDWVMGTEVTRLDEDAVIEAYIEWKQSCVAADRPTEPSEQGVTDERQ